MEQKGIKDYISTDYGVWYFKLEQQESQHQRVLVGEVGYLNILLLPMLSPEVVLQISIPTMHFGELDSSWIYNAQVPPPLTTPHVFSQFKAHGWSL